jgi:hypothetical protein
MNKSFDKILVRRIREVFENHHEQVDRNAWRDMQERLDAGRNLRVVYIRRASRIAAALLVLFLVSWPFNQRIQEYMTSRDNLVLQEEASPPAQESIQQSTKRENREDLTSKDRAEKSAHPSQQTGMLSQKEPEKALPAKEKQTRETYVQRSLISMESLTSKTGKLQKMDPLQWNLKVNQKTEQKKLLLSEQDSRPSDWEKIADKELEKSRQQNVNMGLAFSTLYNYSPKTTNSDMNFSGGMLTEISILPKLTVNTGIMVSRQFFTLNDGQQRLYSILEKSDATRLDYSAPASGEFSLSGSVNHSRRVKLIGLDVPVNLQYHYRNFSISAGISSLTYIREQYKYNYSAEYVKLVYDESNNLANTVNITRSGELEETYQPLRQVDLANILNFSVGYHFTFDHSHLVVQPYIKHPLGNLTSQDIRFGARGIQLQYQF